MADFVDSEAEESDVSFFDFPALLEDLDEVQSCWELYSVLIHPLHFLTQSSIELPTNFAFHFESIDFFLIVKFNFSRKSKTSWNHMSVKSWKKLKLSQIPKKRKMVSRNCEIEGTDWMLL